MSSNWQEDIDVMTEAFGQKVRDVPDSPPVSADEFMAIKELIIEETQELITAIDGGDLVGMADGIVDSLVVILSAASRLGIEVDPLWDIIYENNMTKVGGPKDPVTGKQLKPDDWEPPDVDGELRKQGWLSD